MGQGLGDACPNFELLGDCFSLTALIFFFDGFDVNLEGL